MSNHDKFVVIHVILFGAFSGLSISLNVVVEYLHDYPQVRESIKVKNSNLYFERIIFSKYSFTNFTYWTFDFEIIKGCLANFGDKQVLCNSCELIKIVLYYVDRLNKMPFEKKWWKEILWIGSIGKHLWHLQHMELSNM